MAQHDLKYATLLRRDESIGESLLATARKAIVEKHGLIPLEVFIDGVAVTGVITEGDLDLDLDALGVNLVTFGAASVDASPVAPATPAPSIGAAAAPAEPAVENPLPEPATTTTTSNV